MLNIIIAGLTSFFTDISTEMVYPLLPLFLATTLGASPAIVGVIEGIAESLASVLKVFSGAISDKLGKRKPLAIGGYSFSALGKVALAVAGSWHAVLFGRVIDRFGKGVRTAPRDALIAESSQSGKRGAAFGIHRLMDTLGANVGIILSYYFLSAYRGDYRRVFILSIIPAVMGVVFLFFIREKRSERLEAGLKLSRDKSREERSDGSAGREPAAKVRKMAFKNIPATWRSLNPRLRAFLLVTLMFTLGNSSNQFLLLRAQNVGFSVKDVILLYLTYNLVYAAISYPAGYISDKIGRRSLLVAGYLVYGLVYLGFALVKSKAPLWWLFGAYGIYIGFTEGVEKALVSDIAPPDQKATLIGLHATLVGIGLLPASFLAGLLWDNFGAQVPFYFGGSMGVLAAIALSYVLKDADSGTGQRLAVRE